MLTILRKVINNRSVVSDDSGGVHLPCPKLCWIRSDFGVMLMTWDGVEHLLVWLAKARTDRWGNLPQLEYPSPVLSGDPTYQVRTK